MNSKRMQVLVRLREGVLDVQGKTVEMSLRSSGLDEGTTNIRVGKLIELDVPAESIEEARAKVSSLCEQLLVNPVIESFEIREAQ